MAGSKYAKELTQELIKRAGFGDDLAIDRLNKLAAAQKAELAKRAAAGDDLAMDHVSRMARAKEQGFDVDNVMFHGSSKDIKAFDPDATGVFSSSDAVGNTSFTPDPSQASRYAEEGIYEVWDEDLNRGIDNAINVGGKKSAEGANVGAYLLPDDIKVINSEGKSHSAYWMTEQQEKARREGFKGVRFEGMMDDTYYNPNGMPTDTTKIFDPKNIRSVNAAFDPAKRESSNLLASLAPIAVGAGALAQSDDSEAGAIGKIKELMFLHNTNADKLARTQAMGGMPMPSIAVTKKDIPFDGFGDITLVGKPSNFDPKVSKLNQAFSADAYTVRAPQPVRKARKGAGKQFQAKGGLQDRIDANGGYTAELSSNIWDLQKKGEISESKYNQIVNYFDRDKSIDALFLESKGIDVPESSVDAYQLINKDMKQERIDFGKDLVDEIFEPDEYFISNPNRDYYSTGAKLKPYTADEVTKYMKKTAGRGGEGGMSSGSAGAVRASTTEELKSLQGMRDIKDRLVSADDMAEFKQTSEMMFDDLRDAFRGHYQYDANGFGYYDDFSEFVKLSETKGIDRAAADIGFEVPDGLKTELNEYKDMLRGGATEYFESKPKRVVDLSEFGGAIVPDGTDEATMQMLKRAGIQTESYGDEAGRLAARNKFQDYAFQAAPIGASALIAAGLTPEQAQAAYQSQAYQESDEGINDNWINPALMGGNVPAQRDYSRKPIPAAVRQLIQASESANKPQFGYTPNDSVKYGQQQFMEIEETPWAENSANFIDKWTQTPIGSPLEGTSNYLRNLGRKKSALSRAADSIGLGLDFF